MTSRAEQASDELRDQLQHALGYVYVIERELGGGGMSRVFLARERLLERPVVVKMLHPEAAAAVSIDRFRREIQLAARLQHPHIVPILSAGEVDGVPFYAMPYIEGESLRARIVRGGRAPIVDVVRILHDVIDALAYAHARGVVHRDVKPENVLMCGRHALVTDFGVAKALAAGDRSHPSDDENGFAIGTPAYMAPEQAAGDPSTDHRADIYSFGVLAYELLAGRPPFLSSAAYALLAAHVVESPAPVSALRPDAPPALAELVMRCLEKRPEKRPATAIEIRDVLDAMLTQRRRRRAGVRPPMQRLSSMLAAAGVVGLLAGGSWAVVSGTWLQRTASGWRGERLPVPETRLLAGIGETEMPAAEVPADPMIAKSIRSSDDRSAIVTSAKPIRRPMIAHDSRTPIAARSAQKASIPIAPSPDPALLEGHGHALRIALMAGEPATVERFERIAAFRDSVLSMADSVRRHVTVALVRPKAAAGAVDRVAPRVKRIDPIDGTSETERREQSRRAPDNGSGASAAGVLSPDASASATVRIRSVSFAPPVTREACSAG